MHRWDLKNEKGAHAKNFASFVGARLPSDAEFEFAARSGGLENKYPWGNEENNGCAANIAGCSLMDRAMEVCTSTERTGQDLCDMGGNLWEWVEDDFTTINEAPPEDGRPRIGTPRAAKRIIRGGSFFRPLPIAITTRRGNDDPGQGFPNGGFRVARDLSP